jgi:ubiquinone/menaquinone biosynthesis C-methylase UbiE
MIWKPFDVEPRDVEANRRRYHERVAVYRDYGHDREEAIRFIIDSAGMIEQPVLDIGSGKGFAAVEIARRGIPVKGVDVSEDELTYAYLNARAAGVGSLIEFHIADAKRLPFEDGEFKLVSMVNVLHHLDDFYGVMPEVSRVLAVGGRFLLADFTDEGFAILDRVHEVEKRVHERRNRLNIDDIAQRLGDYGLHCRGRDTRFQEYVMLSEKL